MDTTTPRKYESVNRLSQIHSYGRDTFVRLLTALLERPRHKRRPTSRNGGIRIAQNAGRHHNTVVEVLSSGC